MDLDALAGCLTGRMILPGDDEYESSRRVHQAAVDARPFAIVRAADARDVARTVLFARDNELELAVRGGGHSLAGHGTVDGGIVLDLADMRGLHIDPDARSPGHSPASPRSSSPRRPPPTAWPRRSATPAPSASPG